MPDFSLHRLSGNRDIAPEALAAARENIARVRALHFAAPAFVAEAGLDPAVFLPANIWSDISHPDRFTEWTDQMINLARIVSPFSGFHLAMWARQDAAPYEPRAAGRFYGALFAEKLTGAAIDVAADIAFDLETRMKDSAAELIEGWETLVRGMPEKFRVRLPATAGEIGVLYKGRILNIDLLSYQSRVNALHVGGALALLEQRIAAQGFAHYLEIGSGHCAFAHALSACFGGRLRTVLVDLPSSIANGCAYLACAEGAAAVAVAEPGVPLRTAPNVFIASHLLPAFEAALPAFDLAHNAISMNEMSAVQVEYYVDFIRRALSDGGVFHLSEGERSLDYHVDALAIARGRIGYARTIRRETVGEVALLEHPNSFFVARGAPAGVTVPDEYHHTPSRPGGAGAPAEDEDVAQTDTEHWRTFSIADFSSAFGAGPGEEAHFAEEAARYDFGWRRLTKPERDAAILSILRRVEGFTKVGEHRHGVWTDSWEETRQRYLQSGGDIEALDPPFMGATPIIRLLGDYAIPRDAAFEHHWFRVYRHWLFRKFLGADGPDRVLEFGCGSGFNLATIARLFPDKTLTGLDWAQPAVDLVAQVAADHGFSLTGQRFDYFNLDRDVPIGGAAVCTFCSLEQTGARFRGFFDWLMEAKPALVISMEPGIENYDQDNLFDWLGWRYVQHREYLNGYFAAVREAAASGRAEIIHDHRPGFGSFYHEGYSTIVWRPL